MDVTPRTLTEITTPDGTPAGSADTAAGPDRTVGPGGGGPRDGGGDPGGGDHGGAGRGGGPASEERRGFGRARGWVLGLIVLGALAFVVFRGLGNATLFFYNADEAVAKKAELGDSRFRLQGNVVGDVIDRSSGDARFVVTFDGVDVTVHHRGEIPKLFQPGIPVVMEGRWEGDEFASDRILVKHSEVYVEQNPDRVSAYDEGPTASSVPPAEPATGASS